MQSDVACWGDLLGSPDHGSVAKDLMGGPQAPLEADVMRAQPPARGVVDLALAGEERTSALHAGGRE
jgi:hypothetical protein